MNKVLCFPFQSRICFSFLHRETTVPDSMDGPLGECNARFVFCEFKVSSEAAWMRRRAARMAKKWVRTEAERTRADDGLCRVKLARGVDDGALSRGCFLIQNTIFLRLCQACLVVGIIQPRFS